MVVEYKIRAVDLTSVCNKMHDHKWTMVYLSTMYYNYRDIVMWLTEHCASRVRFHGAAFAFEDEKDAMIFKLRWHG